MLNNNIANITEWVIFLQTTQFQNICQFKLYHLHFKRRKENLFTTARNLKDFKTHLQILIPFEYGTQISSAPSVEIDELVKWSHTKRTAPGKRHSVLDEANLCQHNFSAPI